MKTFTTTEGQEFTIIHAATLPSGQWNRLITVEVKHGERRSYFEAVTSNNRAHQRAKHMDWGQEFFEALFELVQSELDAEITEWINE